jgi:hypothetical protein
MISRFSIPCRLCLQYLLLYLRQFFRHAKRLQRSIRFKRSLKRKKSQRLSGLFVGVQFCRLIAGCRVLRPQLPVKRRCFALLRGVFQGLQGGAN